MMMYSDLSPKSGFWNEELRKLKNQLDEMNIDQQGPEPGCMSDC